MKLVLYIMFDRYRWEMNDYLIALYVFEALIMKYDGNVQQYLIDLLIQLSSYADVLTFFQSMNCVTNGGPDPDKACVFPFMYKGVQYDECTSEGSNTKWCPTQVNAFGYGYGAAYGNRWGHCACTEKRKSMGEELRENAPAAARGSEEAGFTQYAMVTKPERNNLSQRGCFMGFCADLMSFNLG